MTQASSKKSLIMAGKPMEEQRRTCRWSRRTIWRPSSPTTMSPWPTLQYDNVTKSIPGQRTEEKKKYSDLFVKYEHVSVSLNLGYNQIWSITGLADNLMKVRGIPPTFLTDLMWIDLQHNNIVKLPREEFERIPNLKSLYLHRNYINDLKELESLNHLTQLMSLTIHGNPVDRIPHFR